jgi:hypothetical protein
MHTAWVNGCSMHRLGLWVGQHQDGWEGHGLVWRVGGPLGWPVGRCLVSGLGGTRYGLRVGGTLPRWVCGKLPGRVSGTLPRFLGGTLRNSK